MLYVLLMSVTTMTASLVFMRRLSDITAPSQPVPAGGVTHDLGYETSGAAAHITHHNNSKLGGYI